MIRLRAQDGYAVATALIVMSIMLTIGVSASVYVNQQTNSSLRERAGESRLNLTEGVIAAQVFQLSRNWPATSATPYPTCTQSTTATYCPTPAQLKAQFNGVDIGANAKWNVQVHDDDTASATGQFYDDAAVLARPTYDANGNGEMWVRAQGTTASVVAGKQVDQTRTVVARVRVEQKPIAFPDGPFVAGAFGTGNSGNKVIVSTGGKNGVVRCDNAGATPSYKDNPCIGYDVGQVSPVNTVISDANAPSNIIAPGLLDSLRQMAIAKGTYYATGCPANPSGKVVFVENGDACPIYNGNMNVNSAASPGMFIINTGSIKIAGNILWYGVVYAVNAQNSSGTVIEVSGNTDLHGGVFVDGPGRLSVGNSANNLTYDPLVTQTQTAYGTAGIIQNTWRELTPG